MDTFNVWKLQTHEYLSIARDFRSATRLRDRLGYVDYIDIFNRRRRTGYARIYNPGKAGNNLSFFKTAGYNYDRPREEGEGKDW